MSDLTFLYDGRLLHVHPATACVGQDCCIHHPSEHHMVSWPLNWRGDRHLMERLCPHGVGHPDPDSLAYRRRHGFESGGGIHGCDGCCAVDVQIVDRSSTG